MLMLKDIYALGICILEMMIGRVSSTKCSISLDSLPLTWAEFPESTPLIQVLVECINIDSISQRKGKLQNIKKLLIKDYKKFFMRPFYKMELPVIGKRTDVCNKKAIMALSSCMLIAILFNISDPSCISPVHSFIIPLRPVPISD